MNSHENRSKVWSSLEVSIAAKLERPGPQPKVTKDFFVNIPSPATAMDLAEIARIIPLATAWADKTEADLLGRED